MNKAHHKYYSICSKLSLMIFTTCSSFSYAETSGNPGIPEDISINDFLDSQPPELMLAEVDCIDEKTKQPCDGALIIPGAEQGQKTEKKCVRVCSKWGERCTINPRTGQKKCMRTCDKFGEDCF
jgi:hypothetical protein